MKSFFNNTTNHSFWVGVGRWNRTIIRFKRENPLGLFNSMRWRKERKCQLYFLHSFFLFSTLNKISQIFLIHLLHRLDRQNKDIRYSFIIKIFLHWNWNHFDFFLYKVNYYRKENVYSINLFNRTSLFLFKKKRWIIKILIRIRTV